MPALTNFPRRALQRQAYLTLVLLAAGICLCWLSLRIVGMAFPAPLHYVFTCCLVIGFIFWNSNRHPRADVRAWIKLRIQWRRGRWVGLFGFPVGIMLFGVMLGLGCSLETWFSLPRAAAAQTSFTYALIGGLLGFFGGFTVYFPAVHGSAVSRRPA